MSAHRPRHWRLDRDDDGLAWLTLDRADSGTNTLSRAPAVGVSTLVNGGTVTLTSATAQSMGPVVLASQGWMRIMRDSGVVMPASSRMRECAP